MKKNQGIDQEMTVREAEVGPTEGSQGKITTERRREVDPPKEEAPAETITGNRIENIEFSCSLLNNYPSIYFAKFPFLSFCGLFEYMFSFVDLLFN